MYLVQRTQYPHYYIASSIIQLHHHYMKPVTPIPLNLTLFHRILLLKSQTDTIDTVPLIRRRGIPLSLKNMSQMPSALTTHDLRPRHPKSTIRMSRHSAGDSVKVGRPSAARLEFVGGFVKRSIAAGAGIDAGGGHVFVVGAGVRGFGAFFAENAELFWGCRSAS